MEVETDMLKLGSSLRSRILQVQRRADCSRDEDAKQSLT